MSNFSFSPRRSARIQDQSRVLPQSTPAFTYSHPSSTSTTSHPSPATDGLNPPPSTPQTNIRLQSHSNPMMSQQQQQHHHHQLGAPLPSPSANEVPFFSRPHTQPTPFQQQNQNTAAFQQQGFMQSQEQPPQLHPHSNSISQSRPHDVNALAPQMPPDFLAEAAKRAQIACLMRDMGDVTL